MRRAGREATATDTGGRGSKADERTSDEQVQTVEMECAIQTMSALDLVGLRQIALRAGASRQAGWLCSGTSNGEQLLAWAKWHGKYRNDPIRSGPKAGLDTPRANCWQVRNGMRWKPAKPKKEVGRRAGGKGKMVNQEKKEGEAA